MCRVAYILVGQVAYICPFGDYLLDAGREGPQALWVDLPLLLRTPLNWRGPLPHPAHRQRGSVLVSFGVPISSSIAPSSEEASRERPCIRQTRPSRPQLCVP
jgi:hypothetical protein